MPPRTNRFQSTTLPSERKLTKTDMKIAKRILSSFKPYKNQLILVLIAVIITTLLGLVNPFLIKFIFDDAIGKHNLNLLYFYVALMFVTPLLSGIISVGQTYLNNVVGQSIMRDFRNNLYLHLQKMSLRFFTSTKTGDMQSRLSNDIGGLQNVITDTATNVVGNLSIALSTIIAMFFLDTTLTLVSLALLPLFLWVTYKVGKARNLTTKDTQESISGLTSLMQETLSVSGVLLIKTLGRQTFVANKFRNENEKLSLLQIKQQMIGRWFFMFISTFFSVIPAIIYLVAGYEIIKNPLHASITLGGIVAFTTLQSRLFFPIGQLLNVQVEIQGALALFERIFEYMDKPIEIASLPHAVKLSKETMQGKVIFNDVSFHYKSDVQREDGSVKQMQQTLSDISFTIDPGKLVALVGPSGAGKTTITYLLPRLYDVDRGHISIDGVDVRDANLSSLGDVIGMVTQETYLFHTSVKENLLYAKTDATDEEIFEAAKAAEIHDKIMSLEDGYDTIVGERGYKLSGGEKQRIAIARVILKNPKILILDEATSALDTHSERLIQDALAIVMKNRTTLAIAHRLSTILAADEILVLDKGRIIERGNHEKLLEFGGMYKRLYNEQFSD